MDVQEIIKEKKKIEENLRKILIEFEKTTGVIVDNINFKRVSGVRKDNELLSLELSIKMK